MKNTLKHLIIPSLANRPFSTLATHLLGQHAPVFVVHQLSHDKKFDSGITSDHLRKCLNYLVKNKYNFASLKDAIHALKHGYSLPNKTVIFTVDDGFMDQATSIIPIFLEFDCPITFFVVTDMLDQTRWPWDAKVSWLINNSKKQQITIAFEDETVHMDISDVEKKQYARQIIRDFIKETEFENIDDTLNRVAAATGLVIPETPPPLYATMNWDMARELENKGVTFAPHSRTHRILSKIDMLSAKNEIEYSWQRLKEELNAPLDVFCYPTGRKFDFGPREISILKENNFLGAMSTIPGYLSSLKDPDLNLFSLPRFILPESMTDFIQYCSWIEHAKKSMFLFK